MISTLIEDSLLLVCGCGGGARNAPAPCGQAMNIRRADAVLNE
ncbi:MULTISPECIES: hypothetical protein [Cupriavidus]